VQHKIKKLSPAKLIKFEKKIGELFNQKKIKAPIHLYYGNEKQIINVFKKIAKNDWIFCSWRSHYQCLLKGIPEKKIVKSILNGNSIAMCFPEDKIFSSAIVGGTLPIAVGVALAKKLKGNKNKVLNFYKNSSDENDSNDDYDSDKRKDLHKYIARKYLSSESESDSDNDIVV